MLRDRARGIDDGLAKPINAEFSKRRCKAARASQRWRAAMASTVVSYVDGTGVGGSAGAHVRHGADRRRGYTVLCGARRRGDRVMTLLPPGVKVHLAMGYIDMRKGIDGLAMLVQGVLRQGPFSGYLFVFRGRNRANLIKIVYWDGTGLCLFTKRLEHGVFLWPPSIEPGDTLSLTSTQLSSLIDGLDWRAPEQRWRPAVAG